MSPHQEIRLEPDANHLYELFASYVRHYPVHVLLKTGIFRWINDLYNSIMTRGASHMKGVGMLVGNFELNP